MRTRTCTLTVTTGLTIAWLLVTRTRYCVVSGTESTVNEKLPAASVSWALATLENPEVNGNGFCCSCTARPVLPVLVALAWVALRRARASISSVMSSP